MLTADRSNEAPVVMADADLDYWARVYLATNQLHEGVTFEQFLLATPQVRENAARSAALVSRIREERQRITRAKADAAAGERYALSQRDHRALRGLMSGYSARGNGQRIEKLRHRRYPRNGRSAFIKES